MRYLAGIVFIAALLAIAAPAGAHTIAPGWGYAEVDEQPFHEPGGGLLPAHQAYPRGRVKDLGTPDDSAVRINVTAVGANGQTLHTYGVTERHAVYTDFSQRITTTAAIAFLRYDFCKAATGVCAAPYVINRPIPPGGGNTPPLPRPEDRDQDGARANADCDDTNSTVRPGAPERPGNGLDDDCVGGDQPGRLYASLGIGWAVGKVNTSLRRLRVADAPPGARVRVRCLGKRCRFGRREATVDAKGAVNLLPRIRRRLRPRTTLEVTVTAPNMIGKVVRYKMRRGKEPLVRRLCLPPGAAKPGRC
jgi:Putative metal-binding motif